MSAASQEYGDRGRSVRAGDRTGGQLDTSSSSSSFKVEVRTAGDREWTGTGQRFGTAEGARLYAADLAARWTAVSDWRVVESDDEPTDGRAERWAERGAPRPDGDAPAWRVSL